MEIQQMIDVLTAYRDGKTIEFRCTLTTFRHTPWNYWQVAITPTWAFGEFEYRVSFAQNNVAQ